MAYFSTKPAPELTNPTGKNRVWDFFQLSNSTHLANRRQPLQQRRKIRPTATIPASGITGPASSWGIGIPEFVARGKNGLSAKNNLDQRWRYGRGVTDEGKIPDG